jgi:uncharacterized protein YwqG
MRRVGLFSRIFGSTPKTPARQTRDVAALVAGLAQPALQVVAAPFAFRPDSGIPAPRSWFLGEPVLPAGTAWPERNGRRLDFLANLDLAEAAGVQPIDWLPTSGSLAFFYEIEGSPSGHPDEKGSWAAIYSPDSVTTHGSKSRAISFRSLPTYPPSEREQLEALALTDEEWDQYNDLEHMHTKLEYCHQLGGFQKLVQGDNLEIDAQLASNGLAPGPRSYHSERGKALAPGAKDWRLLFQVASDDSLDFMWGDGGNLYFMVRERDARANRFEDVWLGFQCF